MSPSTQCIIEGLEICLYNNNSTFADLNLLQTNGTATGAPNSCSYADLAVTPIDNTVFNAMESSFTEMRYFGRYRDDCFTIWVGERERLDDFLTFLNSQSDQLKFTMEMGDQQLCFLDVKVSIVNNKLETTVYSKPTDSHLYLHASSCHDKASINGIPKGVSLRLRRLCSTESEYDERSIEYMNYLAIRGYDENKVRKAFLDNKKVSREKAREPAKKGDSSPVIFATKYNPRGPNVRDIVKKHLPIVQNAPSLKDVFQNSPILVANKRENNLSDLLLRSDPYNIKPDLTNDEPCGYRKCNKKCDSCQNYVIETDKIKSFATGRVYRIRRSSTCSTLNVIYVAICQKCGKQGVGSTTAWKPRLNNYKSHVKNKRRTCKIATHFIDECADDAFTNVKFVIVDVVNNAECMEKQNLEALLLKKEKFWIGTLVTQHQGLNASHDWNRKTRTEREKISD